MSESPQPDPLFDFKVTYFSNQDGDELRKVNEVNTFKCINKTTVQEKLGGTWKTLFTQDLSC